MAPHLPPTHCLTASSLSVPGAVRVLLKRVSIGELCKLRRQQLANLDRASQHTVAECPRWNPQVS